MENNTLLEKILEAVKSDISPKAFNTWFKSTSLEVKGDNNLIIYVANEFASDWVRKNYFKLLQTTAENLLKKKVEVIITSKNNEEASDTIASLL
ncbi:DnaA N-terminal domain-containing protein [Bacillus sp. AK128]